ncbi:MAG TPA: outer membrane protein assembly factor BamD, partial [bacterium]|nr:outer membrane protein assembly factor BamD [bacterium]
MKKNIFLLLAVTVAISFFSCKTAPPVKGAESDAEVVYRQGLYFLEKGDYNEAEKKFMKVISDFSYSKYEPYATVALGDTFYKKEEYPSALEIYTRFVKMRPGHEKAPWAELQIANSYFAQKPSGFFILPHPSEKDLEVVEKAVEQYRHYLNKYPDDQHKNKGVEMLSQAEGILIERDIRIAEFYKKKKHCPGVRMRLKHISDNFTVTTEKNRKRIASLTASCPVGTKDEKSDEPE